MPLRPNMDTYAWNEYYLVLAAAMLPAIAIEFGERIPASIGGLVQVLNTGVVATLAFIRKPRAQ